MSKRESPTPPHTQSVTHRMGLGFGDLWAKLNSKEPNIPLGEQEAGGREKKPQETATFSFILLHVIFHS